MGINRRDALGTGFKGLLGGVLAAVGLASAEKEVKAAPQIAPEPKVVPFVDAELEAALEVERTTHAKFDLINMRMRELALQERLAEMHEMQLRGGDGTILADIRDPEATANCGMNTQEIEEILGENKAAWDDVFELSLLRTNAFSAWSRAKENVTLMILKRAGNDTEKVKAHPNEGRGELFIPKEEAIDKTVDLDSETRYRMIKARLQVKDKISKAFARLRGRKVA